MCGIAGIWKLEETGFDFLPLIKKIMEVCESRGTDATGVAFLAKKEGMERTLFFHKLPIRPKDYAKQYADNIIPKNFKGILIHNRHATQGPPAINNNNHPFVANQPVPFAFIHNGCISTRYKGVRPRPAETDSVDVFLEIWDEIEKAPQPENRMAAVTAAMEKHDGSMTIAMLFPESIVIARHSNPVWLAYVPHLKCIVFASTDDILGKALDCTIEPVYTLFRPYTWREMKNDTILKIDDHGVTLGGEVEVGKLRTQTTEERQWFSYGSPCEPEPATKGRMIFEWKGGKDFAEREPAGSVAAPPLPPQEGEVGRAMLKAGDLAHDLEGWRLKYLVVYSVVHDGVWGLFGETLAEARTAFLKEREWKSSTKGGNIKWTKSDRFKILERGLTRAGIPETPIKQSPPEGTVAKTKLKVGDLVETSVEDIPYLIITKLEGLIVVGYIGRTPEDAREAARNERLGRTASVHIRSIKRTLISQIEEPEVLSTYKPVATDQKLEADWERYLQGGEEAGN